MRRFVFWTGVYNIVAASAFFSPSLLTFLRINAPESELWCRLPAMLVIFLGVLLVLCSRDLIRRGSIVYWEGILRIALAPVLAGHGYLDDVGVMFIALGVTDLLIGLVYVIGLPIELKRTAKHLLLDTRDGPIQ